MSPGADGSHDGASLVVVDVAERPTDAGEEGICGLLLEDALAAVAEGGVGHFVPHYNCESSFALGNREDSGVNADFPAGEAESVHLGAANEGDFPPEVFSPFASGSGKAFGTTADGFVFAAAFDGVALAEDFTVGLEAELGFLFSAEGKARGAACVVSTHHRFAAQEVRHCCTLAVLEASIVWSDSLADHAERIGRLYAGTLGGQELAADRSALLASDNSAREADGTPGSLVSFLINV